MQTLEVTNDQRDFWDQEASRFCVAHPFNSFGWGKVRECDGWKATYLITRGGTETLGMATVLTKRLPVLGRSIMVIPRGPLFDPSRPDALHSLFERLLRIGEEQRALFVRIEPNLPDDSETVTPDPFLSEGFLRLPHRWSFWNSPRDVYRIDLSKATTEEELFGTLDKDARRCIRKAEREGVLVRSGESLGDIRKFYKLFKEHSIDKKFMVRKLGYQEALWTEFLERGNGRLFLDTYEGDIIGGLICLLFGNICVAMHMGAPYRFRHLQPQYAHIWESLRWAKKKGCIWYSFRGVGTTPTQEKFKRKFGPEVVSLVGYYDLPLHPLYYRVFSAVEFEALPRAWPALMKVRKVINLG